MGHWDRAKYGVSPPDKKEGAVIGSRPAWQARPGRAASYYAVDPNYLVRVLSMREAWLREELAQAVSYREAIQQTGRNTSLSEQPTTLLDLTVGKKRHYRVTVCSLLATLEGQVIDHILTVPDLEKLVELGEKAKTQLEAT